MVSAIFVCFVCLLLVGVEGEVEWRSGRMGIGFGGRKWDDSGLVCGRGNGRRVNKWSVGFRGVRIKR